MKVVLPGSRHRKHHNRKHLQSLREPAWYTLRGVVSQAHPGAVSLGSRRLDGTQLPLLWEARETAQAMSLS